MVVLIQKRDFVTLRLELAVSEDSRRGGEDYEGQNHEDLTHVTGDTQLERPDECDSEHAYQREYSTAFLGSVPFETLFPYMMLK